MTEKTTQESVHVHDIHAWYFIRI